jgi:hypothetical protein
MSPDQLNELKNSEVTRKRLAKFMAHFCFRNSKLEDFHDRISDAEMKALMIDVVNHSHLFLSVLFSSTASNEIIEILKQGDDLPPEWKDWNEPEISDELTKNAKRVLDLIAKSRQ